MKLEIEFIAKFFIHSLLYSLIPTESITIILFYPYESEANLLTQLKISSPGKDREEVIENNKWVIMKMTCLLFA